MKKIFGLFFSFLMCLSFASCAVPAEAQIYESYSYDGVDIDVVVTYGTPYYNSEGLLLYYIYRDLFYYPFYSGNRWYLRPHTHAVRYYKPVPRDFYRHNPHANYDRIVYGGRHHRGNTNIRPNVDNKRRPNDRIRPGIGNNRPNMNTRPNNSRPQFGGRGGSIGRPNHIQRSSTRESHFGGRR